VLTVSTISSRFLSPPDRRNHGAVPWSIKNVMFHDKPVPLSNQRMHGYRKVWVYCSNPDCRNSAVLDVDHLPDEATYNDLMPRMLWSVITAAPTSPQPGTCEVETKAAPLRSRSGSLIPISFDC
jgi:hypothetical protein